MKFTTTSPEETEKIGARLAAALFEGGHKRAFIAFRGEMGVGKTAFTRGFASYFGIKSVKSPTYTVVNEYRGKASLYHFDMYRIESEDDLISIGFDDYVEATGYCIAEWSENISELLPEDSLFVEISRTGNSENERIIEIFTDGIYEDISL